MSSPVITTIVQMLEALPIEAQEHIADKLKEYIEDFQDEQCWERSFQQTRPQLIAAAQQAKREIAAGKATPMDYEQL